MHNAFVSLDEYLRPPTPEAAPPAEPEASLEAGLEAPPHEDWPACEEALADVRRFRAALADVLDATVERLLCEIAATVLARELRLAPSDLQAIVARELALAGETPLRLRAHPLECDALRDFACAVVADTTLRRGDVLLELRSGTINATLGCRLERALGSTAA